MTAAKTDGGFMPRNASWPQPPEVHIEITGQHAELKITATPGFLLTLSTLAAQGSRATAAELIGPQAKDTDRQLLYLSTCDALEVCQRIVNACEEARRAAELQAAQRMQPIEPNEP